MIVNFLSVVPSRAYCTGEVQSGWTWHRSDRFGICKCNWAEFFSKIFEHSQASKSIIGTIIFIFYSVVERSFRFRNHFLNILPIPVAATNQVMNPQLASPKKFKMGQKRNWAKALLTKQMKLRRYNWRLVIVINDKA